MHLFLFLFMMQEASYQALLDFFLSLSSLLGFFLVWSYVNVVCVTGPMSVLVAYFGSSISF